MSKAIQLLLLTLSLWLTGCQTAPNGSYLSTSELNPFMALNVESRVFKNGVKIRWEAREDVAAYCAQTLGMDKERAFSTPPLACAIWSRSAQECTVVTGKVTTHVALGHEVRHCFEGAFHP